MIRRFVPAALAAAVFVTGVVLAQDPATPAVQPTAQPTEIQPQDRAQTMAPVTLASLPAVLDRPATYEDAVPDGSGVRRAVIMGGLDKITARTVRIIAPVGVTVRFKKLLITARTCYVRPQEETPETSVFVEVSEPAPQGEGLQRLFSGWMFASSPGLNALEHPVYDVWVVGCHVDDPNNPGAPSSIVSDAEEAPVDQPSIDDTIKDDDAARE